MKKLLLIFLIFTHMLFSQTIELSSGTPLADSILLGETKFYKITAKNGQTVDSIIEQLTDDADIYIRIGAEPTGTIYDCKSTRGGISSDGCSVIMDSDNDVYLGVYGYRAAEYNIKATVTGIVNNIVTLTSGVAVSNTIIQGATHYYKIHINAGQTFATQLMQMTDDADLLVQIGSKPTDTYKACTSTNGGINNEICQFSLRTEADVYIGVYGFRTTNYTIEANITTTTLDSNIIENGENGLNPNWQTDKGEYSPILYNRPNLPLAPSGTKVIVFPLDSSRGQHTYYTSYSIPLNDTIHKVLEMDFGGTPNYNIPYHSRQGLYYPGYLIHYSVGVEVETMLGTRRMSWDSYFSHNGVGPHKGVGNWLEYGSPAEMVRGYLGISINLWNHFKVDLEEQLQLLEPNNRIVKVNYFFTLGGTLDNIQLSTN